MLICEVCKSEQCQPDKKYFKSCNIYLAFKRTDRGPIEDWQISLDGGRLHDLCEECCEALQRYVGESVDRLLGVGMQEDD